MRKFGLPKSAADPINITRAIKELCTSLEDFETAEKDYAFFQMSAITTALATASFIVASARPFRSNIQPAPRSTKRPLTSQSRWNTRLRLLASRRGCRRRVFPITAQSEFARWSRKCRSLLSRKRKSQKWPAGACAMHCSTKRSNSERKRSVRREEHHEDRPEPMRLRIGQEVQGVLCATRAVT